MSDNADKPQGEKIDIANLKPTPLLFYIIALGIILAVFSGYRTFKDNTNPDPENNLRMKPTPSSPEK